VFVCVYKRAFVRVCVYLRVGVSLCVCVCARACVCITWFHCSVECCFLRRSLSSLPPVMNSDAVLMLC
jgi:hypothetical protein